MRSTAPRLESCSRRARPPSCRSPISTPSRGFPHLSSTSSRPFRTPSGCSALLVALLALAGIHRAAAGQQQDEALVGQLARLLAAADARRFDAPLFREALHHPEAFVRRQAALAAGRIGD